MLSSVVGGVVGVGVVAIFIGLGVCVIMACVLHKEKGVYILHRDRNLIQPNVNTVSLTFNCFHL